MEKKYIDMLEQIGTITYVKIGYSTYTHKFYLSVDLQITENDKYIRTFGEHKDTPEQAIESAFEEMKNAEGVYWINKITGEQKMWHWDGNKFVLISDEYIPENIELDEVI